MRGGRQISEVIGLRLGSGFGSDQTLFGLSFVYLLFVVSRVLIEMDPFYFWKVHLVIWGNNKCDSYFRRHIKRISILGVIVILVAKLLLNH